MSKPKLPMRSTFERWVYWFYENADFGPASDDVLAIMLTEFIAQNDIDQSEGGKLFDEVLG